MKKIKIGLFIDTYFPMIDGVTMVVDNYAKKLSKYADVVVFAPKYKGFDDSNLNYKIIRCKSIKVPFLDYVLPLPNFDRKFKEKLNELDLDIIHIHSPATLGMLGLKYAKKNKIPIIGTVHSQYKQDIKRMVKFNFLTKIITKKVTNIYEKCDYVWAVNDAVAKLFHEDYGFSKLVPVVRNATEMELISDRNEAINFINKKHNIKKNEKVFLFVGRINKLKNIFFIIDSLKYVKDINYKMIFVGSGHDEDALKKYIVQNSLNDKVILCGKVSDRKFLSYYYARADLFLFPSLYDCNSIVQIEAASQKTPTLFIEGAVTSNDITDNLNGYLEKYDAKKYGQRINKIFSDTNLYKKVCENCYKDIYINWDDTIKEIYNIYLSFING